MRADTRSVLHKVSPGFLVASQMSCACLVLRRVPCTLAVVAWYTLRHRGTLPLSEPYPRFHRQTTKSVRDITRFGAYGYDLDCLNASFRRAPASGGDGSLRESALIGFAQEQRHGEKKSSIHCCSIHVGRKTLRRFVRAATAYQLPQLWYQPVAR